MADDRHADPDDLEPHSKPNLTSAFGRLVERATYGDVLIAAGVVLFGSALWYALAPVGQGLKPATHDLLEATYFSFVTFTSLGYGDLNPVGVGRGLAVFEVVSGLTFTAAFIGKVASERQASLLMLLHTSDTQKRISDFTERLGVLRRHIDDLASQFDFPGLIEALERQPRLISGLRSYLVFNSHQATVLQLGNFTALIALYDEFDRSFEHLKALHQRAGDFTVARPMRRCLSNLEMLARTLERLDQLHLSVRRGRSLWGGLLEWLGLIKPPAISKIELAAAAQAKDLAGRFAKVVASERAWAETGVHVIQRERVLAAFPAKSRDKWPTGITKVVAAQLGISIAVTGKCVDALLASGDLPKSVKP
jgi:hypothetical protein